MASVTRNTTDRLSDAPSSRLLPELMRPVVARLALEAGLRVSVSEFAILTHCSTGQLRRLLRQHGVTPSQVLQRLSVQYALMLIERGCKIEAAVTVVGFRNRTHFNRLCRRAVGRSPVEYRRHFREHHRAVVSSLDTIVESVMSYCEVVSDGRQ